MKREIEGLLELEDLDMPEPPPELTAELADAEARSQPRADDRRETPSRARRA